MKFSELRWHKLHPQSNVRRSQWLIRRNGDHTRWQAMHFERPDAYSLLINGLIPGPYNRRVTLFELASQLVEFEPQEDNP